MTHNGERTLQIFDTHRTYEAKGRKPRNEKPTLRACTNECRELYIKKKMLRNQKERMFWKTITKVHERENNYEDITDMYLLFTITMDISSYFSHIYCI